MTKNFLIETKCHKIQNSTLFEKCFLHLENADHIVLEAYYAQKINMNMTDNLY